MIAALTATHHASVLVGLVVHRRRPAGCMTGFRSIVVAARSLLGSKGLIVCAAAPDTVNSRTICYVHICRSEVGEAGEAAPAVRSHRQMRPTPHVILLLYRVDICDAGVAIELPVAGV